MDGNSTHGGETTKYFDIPIVKLISPHRLAVNFLGRWKCRRGDDIRPSVPTHAGEDKPSPLSKLTIDIEGLYRV